MESLLILMYLFVPMATVESPYVGAGAGITTYSNDDSSTFTMLGMHGRLGATLNDYLATEIRYGLSFKDKADIDNTETEVHVKGFGGAYLLAYAPVSEKTKPYALLGYSKAKVNLVPSNPSIKESDEDFSYGIGLEHRISKVTTIGAEYASYIKSDETGDIAGFNLNVKFDF